MAARRMPPAGRPSRTPGHRRPPIRPGVLSPVKPLAAAARVDPTQPMPQPANPAQPKGGPGA